MVLLYHRWVSPRLAFNSSNLESRNVLKQVLIKSREEFIYIYPPLSPILVSAPLLLHDRPLLLHILLFIELRWSTDDEFGEKTVSILLDGEESEMVFIDHPHVEMSVSTILSVSNELIRPRVLVPRHQISLKFL